MGATFSRTDVSSRREGAFFSVARTIPLVANCQLVSFEFIVAVGSRQVEAMTSDRYVVMVYEMNVPLIPNDVVPPATAAKACSI